MTIRLPVSSIQNKWADAQRVDLSDMDTEQQYNNYNDAAIVQNFFGSGVLLENSTPNIIFDTDPTKLSSIESALISAHNFDGTGISPQNQPTDTQYGNQLAVQLTDSIVFGRESVKVLIIGLDFNGNLQYDRFEFHRNETQTTYKHYTKILTIIFNDFLGNFNCSCLHGGRVVIREALPFELNRDSKSVSQDIMPDIFIRDIKTANCSSIYSVIQEGIGSEYDANTLEINITGKQPSRAILAGDITTQIGQKFKSTSNNIQKITLLMGVSKDNTADAYHKYDWDGDIVVSVYKLQTTVSSYTDIVPELAIDFDPEQRPLAELSFSKSELKNIGYVLTDLAQPIDFVFSNTQISTANGIEVDKYYAITVRRSGLATTGDIFLEVGTNKIDNSRLTIFNGLWVDVSEEDLWFQVWSDTAKIASGQAYDRGNGINSPKISQDLTTGAMIDYYERNLNFVATGQGTINNAVVQANLSNSLTVQDERTGNNIYSRKQYTPSFSFVNNSNLATLKETSEPLILGCMADFNPKTIETISGTIDYIGLVQGDIFRIINPNSDLVSAKLIGRKLIPQSNCGTNTYTVMKVDYCIDGYGDVNGDGYIDAADVLAAANLIDEGINLPSTQQKILDGYINTLDLLRADVDGDGYVSINDVNLIESYVNRITNSFPVGSSFSHLTLQVQPSVLRWDGYHNCCNSIYIDGYTDGYGLCRSDQVYDPSIFSKVEQEYYGNYGIVPDIDLDNNAFRLIPFSPIDFEIQYQPFWQDWLLALSSETRKLPVSFTIANSLNTNSCGTPQLFSCVDLVGNVISCDPGRNDFYIPGNLIIDGQLTRSDGNLIKNDIEIGIINLELPDQAFTESSINVFNSFVADRGDLFTISGYPAMKYADCSTVQPEDLALNKIRFNVSIQSFFPSLNGYSPIDGYGIIIDDIVGVYMDSTTGVLKLTIKDLDLNPLFKTLITKLQIIVYLRKSGWNNSVITITPTQVANLLT